MTTPVTAIARSHWLAMPLFSVIGSALLVAGVAGTTSCATSPTGRKQLILLPEDQVASLGATAYADMKKAEKVSTSSVMSGYVNCIAQAILAANRSQVGKGWEVTTFDSDQINAFALPGRKIGIYSGMANFADNASQLAAVMGHEVGHVLARHGNERMSEALAAQSGLGLLAAYQGGGETKQVLLAALGLGYDLGIAKPHSRTQESEADQIGLVMMAKAGFDPGQAVALWQKMATRGNSGPEFLSTHPAPSKRAQALKALQSQAKPHYNQAVAAGRRPQCRKP
ncbi:MAG: M48 family metallopeptidase [Myxococcales bacterium]|nr:M48 family metallopeptidase [Myxococcales bacterium]